MLSGAHMQIFGDPETMARMTRQFMNAASYGTATDGLMKSLPPQAQELLMEFGADLSITYVMGGLAREFEPPHESRLLQWLDWADRSGMPFDPRTTPATSLPSMCGRGIAIPGMPERTQISR